MVPQRLHPLPLELLRQVLRQLVVFLSLEPIQRLHQRRHSEALQCLVEPHNRLQLAHHRISLAAKHLKTTYSDRRSQQHRVSAPLPRQLSARPTAMYLAHQPHRRQHLHSARHFLVMRPLLINHQIHSAAVPHHSDNNQHQPLHSRRPHSVHHQTHRPACLEQLLRPILRRVDHSSVAQVSAVRRQVRQCLAVAVLVVVKRHSEVPVHLEAHRLLGLQPPVDLGHRPPVTVHSSRLDSKVGLRDSLGLVVLLLLAVHRHLEVRLLLERLRHSDRPRALVLVHLLM